MDEIKRLNHDLKANAELGNQLNQAIKSAAAAGAKSDGEAMVNAAKSLGYDISIAELEKAQAQAQEMSEDELEQAAGGGKGLAFDQDEKGHNSMCAIAWHCFVVTLHTESESENVACFLNYQCIQASVNGMDGM